jgi:hypothetical protein
MSSLKTIAKVRWIVNSAVKMVLLTSMLITIYIEKPICIRNTKILEVEQTVGVVLLDELHEP